MFPRRLQDSNKNYYGLGKMGLQDVEPVDQLMEPSGSISRYSVVARLGFLIRIIVPRESSEESPSESG